MRMVAVKNHANALLNEFAHLHQPITIEGILDSILAIGRSCGAEARAEQLALPAMLLPAARDMHGSAAIERNPLLPTSVACIVGSDCVLSSSA